MNPRPPTAPRASGRRTIAKVLLLLVTVEVCSALAAYVLRSKGYLFRPPVPPNRPEVKEIPYSEYLRIRDPVLGWPRESEFGGPQYGPDGSRPSPANAALPADGPYVAAYGDSFTGSANSDEDAWANRLAESLGRRVLNFGVGGYATDQALLRYERSRHPAGTVVLLSLMPENMVRCLTRNRDLLNGRLFFAYKPRFAWDDAARGLRLVPLPELSEEDHLRYLGLASPLLPLEDESFQPGGPTGVAESSFPFTLTLVRAFGGYRLRARLTGRPWHAEFYEPGHPLRGLEMMEGIVHRFVLTAKERGHHPVFAVLPTIEDVEFRARSGTWCYDALEAHLAAAGIPAHDFGDVLLAAKVHEDRGVFFDSSGHYTPRTDAMLRDFLLPVLKAHPGLR